MNDSGAIKGMDAREDGVYITYVPAAGADAVTKKLGNSPIIISQFEVNYGAGGMGVNGGSTLSVGVEGYTHVSIGSYTHVNDRPLTITYRKKNGTDVKYSKNASFSSVFAFDMTDAVSLSFNIGGYSSQATSVIRNIMIS